MLVIQYYSMIYVGTIFFKRNIYKFTMVLLSFVKVINFRNKAKLDRQTRLKYVCKSNEKVNIYKTKAFL